MSSCVEDINAWGSNLLLLSDFELLSQSGYAGGSSGLLIYEINLRDLVSWYTFCGSTLTLIIVEIVNFKNLRIIIHPGFSSKTEGIQKANRLSISRSNRLLPRRSLSTKGITD